MFRIAAFFLFFFNTAITFANPPIHYVSEILDQGNQIKTDDGFVWEVYPKVEYWGYVFNDYPSIASHWLPGDEVDLYFMDVGETTRHIVFYLTNLRTQDNVLVKYGEQNGDWVASTLLSIDWEGYQITKSLVCQIVFSDGSCFDVEGYFNTCSVANWEIGDKVTIYHSKEGHWILLNADQGNKLNWMGGRYNYHYSSAYAHLQDDKIDEEVSGN